MPAAQLIRRIGHSPADLIDLVADVERYPEFINLISALRITNVMDPDHFEAEAVVAFQMFRERFRSLVKIDRAQNSILVKKAQKGGAVRTLVNDWTFHELSDGSTLVEFEIEVRLKAFPLEMLIRDKFPKASRHIMGVFEARAAQIKKPVGDADLDLDAEYERLGLSQGRV